METLVIHHDGNEYEDEVVRVIDRLNVVGEETARCYQLQSSLLTPDCHRCFAENVSEPDRNYL